MAHVFKMLLSKHLPFYRTGTKEPVKDGWKDVRADHSHQSCVGDSETQDPQLSLISKGVSTGAGLGKCFYL